MTPPLDRESGRGDACAPCGRETFKERLVRLAKNRPSVTGEAKRQRGTLRDEARGQAARTPIPSVFLCEGCHHGDNYDFLSELYCARGQVVQDRAIVSIDEVCANCGEAPAQSEVDEFVRKDLELRLLRATMAKAERSLSATGTSKPEPAAARPMPRRELPLLLSIPRAARSLGKSPTTIRGLIATGHLEAVPDGRRTKVRRSAIERLVAVGVPSVEDAPARPKRAKKARAAGTVSESGSVGDAIRALKL